MKLLLVAALGSLFWPSLASAQSTSRLFAVNNNTSNRFLATIDKITGAVTQLGFVAFKCEDMAFHPDGRLFAADSMFGQLVILDKNTGAVDSIIGPYLGAGGELDGLAFHPDGTLYGVHSDTDALATVNTSTGAVTPVGSFGLSNVAMTGLSWSLDGSTLYGIDYRYGCLYTIDPRTGLATLRGCGDPFEPLGLATDPVDGQLYTVEWLVGADMVLAHVDPNDGSRTAVRAMGGAIQVEGISFETFKLYDSYCTSTLNSTGSMAEISSYGSPSIAADNLILTASSVPDQPGLFLHASAQIQAPFGNGFLCTNSGMVLLGPPAVALGQVATRVVDVPLEVGILGQRNFQYWFRDPADGGAFFNTSDALSIVFVP